MFVLCIIVFIGLFGPVAGESTQQSFSSNFCVENHSILPLFSTKILHFSFNQTENLSSIVLSASILDGKVAQFDDQRETFYKRFQFNRNQSDEEQDSLMSYDLVIHATFINRTRLDYSIEFFYNDEQKPMNVENCSVILLISQPQRFRDRFFKRLIPFIIIFISIQMGILLDVKVLKEILIRPIPIAIGFCCQYGLMPLIAFSISKIFDYPTLYGLGLFLVGCCPGGSASNQWTIIFDGDLNLSAFMSFASTVASFFMMPIWLFTLGKYAYLRDLNIQIPFLHLVQSLLTTIGPLGFGMVIVYFIPKLKTIVHRIVKPMLLILILYFFIFGAYVNFYLFAYIDLKTALSAPLLPWFGFLLGGAFAAICGQDWKRTITIGIETGSKKITTKYLRES